MTNEIDEMPACQRFLEFSALKLHRKPHKDGDGNWIGTSRSKATNVVNYPAVSFTSNWIRLHPFG